MFLLVLAFACAAPAAGSASCSLSSWFFSCWLEVLCPFPRLPPIPPKGALLPLWEISCTICMPLPKHSSCCLVCLLSLLPPKDHTLFEGMIWGVLYILSWARMEKVINESERGDVTSGCRVGGTSASPPLA